MLHKEVETISGCGFQRPSRETMVIFVAVSFEFYFWCWKRRAFVIKPNFCSQKVEKNVPSLSSFQLCSSSALNFSLSVSNIFLNICTVRIEEFSESASGQMYVSHVRLAFYPRSEIPANLLPIIPDIHGRSSSWSLTVRSREPRRRFRHVWTKQYLTFLSEDGLTLGQRDRMNKHELVFTEKCETVPVTTGNWTWPGKLSIGIWTELFSG